MGVYLARFSMISKSILITDFVTRTQLTNLIGILSKEIYTEIKHLKYNMLFFKIYRKVEISFDIRLPKEIFS